MLTDIEDAARRSGVRSEVVDVESDSPAAAILGVAQERACDLIVMASHGRKGLSRVLLGSQATKVLAHADRAVLVAR